MPHWTGLGSRTRVEKDFVEADVDTAFALLFAAETQGLARDHANALRAIEEAEKAIGDGEQRLRGLEAADRDRLGPQLQRMRGVVEGVRTNLKVS